MTPVPTPVVFLDRDGVINVDRDDYVKCVEELIVFPYAPDAIARLNNAGYIVVVVSNQQCVAKGIMSMLQLKEIEDAICRQVETAGGYISAFHYCTHLKSQNCSCRKPKPGMLKQAISDLNLDPAKGFIVGDNEKDAVAGKAVGCQTVLVLSGMATMETAKNMLDPADFVADNLDSAVDWILEQTREPQVNPTPV